VVKVINEVRKKVTNADVAQVLEKLKIEGENFNIRMEETEVLKQVRSLRLFNFELN
jgi:uncharacterized protein YcgL (UPF0745 family)